MTLLHLPQDHLITPTLLAKSIEIQAQVKAQNPKKKAWKRLARASPSPAPESINKDSGKRLLMIDNSDEPVDLPDFKRLRVLDTNLDSDSMETAAAAPGGDPRQTQ